MFTKLISGKVTLVHRKLWPEIFAIGTARAPWQMKGLSKSARNLLEMIDEQGSLRTDQLAWPKSGTAKPGEAARELEKKLLIYAGQFHTESGAHAKLLETWKTWALGIDFPIGTMQLEKAMQKMEGRVRKLNEEFEAKARLPWLWRSCRGFDADLSSADSQINYFLLRWRKRKGENNDATTNISRALFSCVRCGRYHALVSAKVGF